MENDSLWLWAFGIFAVLLFGCFFLIRRQDPRVQKVWLPRLALFVMILASPIFLAPAANVLIRSFDWQSVLIAAMLVGFYALIVNANVFQTRVCESCAKMVQPPFLLKPAAHCPKCGTGLSRAKLFGGG